MNIHIIVLYKFYYININILQNHIINFYQKSSVAIYEKMNIQYHTLLHEYNVRFFHFIFIIK